MRRSSPPSSSSSRHPTTRSADSGTLPDTRHFLTGSPGRASVRATDAVPSASCGSFFAEADWIRQSDDWHARTVSDKRYDLALGEGARIWTECLARARAMPFGAAATPQAVADLPIRRYGVPFLVQPRLGQGTFRIAVMDAYKRTCAVTTEHSLPALEAADIRSFGCDGPHDVRNGLLLRADFHRLFDQGYVTVSEDYRLEASPRLKQEYHNGRSYYPYHGTRLALPAREPLRPSAEYLAWHREHVYAA